MNLTNEQKNGVTVVRIGETRMMYPLLADFSGAIAQLLAAGQRKMLLDFTTVTYVDSATIGCLARSGAGRAKRVAPRRGGEQSHSRRRNVQGA